MNSNTKNITQTAIFTAALCVISPLSLSLPVSPVPISLATFIVYLFSIILGIKKSIMGIFVYILIGIAGFPVFSKGASGISVVFGPTGGYLVGYFICSIGASISDKISRKISNKRLIRNIILFLFLVLDTIVFYIFGTVWLSYLNNLDFYAALSAGVIPFIPGDLAKIIITVILAYPIKSRLINFL